LRANVTSAFLTARGSASRTRSCASRPLARVCAVFPGWTEPPMTRDVIDPEQVAGGMEGRTLDES